MTPTEVERKQFELSVDDLAWRHDAEGLHALLFGEEGQRHLIAESKAHTPAGVDWKVTFEALALRNLLHVERAARLALGDTVKSLSQRLKAIEERPGTVNTPAPVERSMRNCGVWREESAPFRPGDVTTHRGQLWHCWTATHEKPGESDHWQLMAKGMPR